MIHSFGTLKPSMAEEFSFLPHRRTHLNSPISHSLATILSLYTNTNESAIARDSDVSLSCSFKSNWVPIDFNTSSIRCPKALNVLLGRSFSLRTGSCLNPPSCPVETNGCTCRKRFSESQFGFEGLGACNDSGPSSVSVSEALKAFNDSDPTPVCGSDDLKRCNDSDPSLVSVSEDPETCKASDPSPIPVSKASKSCNDADPSPVPGCDDPKTCDDSYLSPVSVSEEPKTCKDSDPSPVSVSEDPKTCKDSDPPSVSVSGAPKTCNDSDPSLVSVDFSENRLLQPGNYVIDKSRVETKNPFSERLNIGGNPVSISDLDSILSFGTSSKVCDCCHDDPATATGMRSTCPISDPSLVSVNFSENILLQLVNDEIDDSRLEETLIPPLQNPVIGETPEIVSNMDSIPIPQNISELSKVGDYSHNGPATATGIGTTCLGYVQSCESQLFKENSIVLRSGGESVPRNTIVREADNELGTTMQMNYAEKSMRETVEVSCLPKETSHAISQLGHSTGIDAEDPRTGEFQTTSGSDEISKLLNNLNCTINFAMVDDLIGSTDQNKHVTLANSAAETRPTFSEINVTDGRPKMLEDGEMEEGEISDKCLDTGDFDRTSREPLVGGENEVASTAFDNISAPYATGGSKKLVENELMESDKEVNSIEKEGNKGVAIQVQEMTSTGKNLKAPKKEKRLLTEERKAKRKEAKKRKRAKMNIELGVKRLRLLPVSKPKKVYDCKFYMGGRCQQGDKCKFSHNIIPLTKSQPCIHLAKQHCLKGDDCPFDHDLSKYPCLYLPTQQCFKGDNCPFDHDLSKYPCRNYQSSGTCYRGDRCLFSHKLPLVEPNSGEALKVKIPEPPLPMFKTNIKKPVNAKATTATATSLSLPSKEQTADKKLNPPAQQPEGIKFFSFGKATLTDDANNQQQEKDLPFKKADFYSRHALRSGGEDGDKNYPSSARKAVLQTLAFAAKYESELLARQPFRGPMDADNSSCKGSSSNRVAVTSPSADMFMGGSNHASKILKEFLFGGAMD